MGCPWCCLLEVASRQDTSTAQRQGHADRHHPSFRGKGIAATTPGTQIVLPLAGRKGPPNRAHVPTRTLCFQGAECRWKGNTCYLALGRQPGLSPGGPQQPHHLQPSTKGLSLPSAFPNFLILRARS